MTPTPPEVIDAVAAKTTPTNQTRAPPETVLASLEDDQQAAVQRLWQRVPPHLYQINFDFEKALWTAGDIDVVEDLLCKYEHRFFTPQHGRGPRHR